jgi:ribosomal protein S18 acetylase RimI-like enzyme
MKKNEGPRRQKKRVHVKIREMEIDDIAPVFHLGEELFTPRDVPNLYRTWDEYEVTGLFHDEPEFCLVAEVDDKIVGFALGTTIFKAGSAWKYGHLIWLGVAEECRRLGVAKRLLRGFTDIMLEYGVRILLVDTETANTPAIEFFKKMGFGNPQEHIYLTLNLDTMLKKSRKKKSDEK